jgi:hypothetical protein
MRNMLLMSVAAAALIAGSGFASAQGPNQSREGSSPAPAAQPSAPAEKMAPAEKVAPMKGASETKTPDAGLKAGQAQQKMAPSMGETEQKAAPGIKAGQADQMEPKRATPKQAQDNPKDGMKPDTMGSGTQSQIKPDGKTNSDAKADGKPTPDVKADTKSSEKVGDAKTSITGQGAAAGTENLSTEQRTTIRTVIRQQKVQPEPNVNFSISVGSRVSDNVHFYPVPTELVQIQPHWRGYEFILVGDQIIVVNPQTHQIVAVLDA